MRLVTLVAGSAAVMAALVNIKDFAWFRRGPSLVMPESAKPGIFGRMLDLSDQAKLSTMLIGTAVVAAAANLYEAICTGGFPVVFTRILTLQTSSTIESYLWIALYNVIYVLPLFAIVVLFTRTLGSHTVTIVEARRLKLLSGLLMLGLGLLLLLAPDRLGDLVATIMLFGLAVVVWLAFVLLDRRMTARAALPAAPARVPPRHRPHSGASRP